MNRSKPRISTTAGVTRQWRDEVCTDCSLQEGRELKGLIAALREVEKTKITHGGGRNGAKNGLNWDA